MGQHLAVAARWAFRLLLLAALGLVLVVLGVLTVVPRAVDGAALTVLTGSMTPSIPVGSVVIVRPVDPGTLAVGDVVTYQKAPGQDEYVTHRIEQIHTDTQPVTLTTRGDANRGSDVDPVPVTAVRGRVLFHLPYVGTLRNSVSLGGSGLLLVVLALLGYAVSQVVSVLRERARSGRTGVRTAGQGPTTTSPGPSRQAETRAVDTGLLQGQRVDLQLLVATLPTRRFNGLPPETIAQLLRMDLVDVGADTFTVTLAREPSHLDVLVGLLAPFSPVQLARSEVLSVRSCPQVVVGATDDHLSEMEASGVAAA